MGKVMFGKIAKEWRDSNPNEKGSIRDNFFVSIKLVFNEGLAKGTIWLSLIKNTTDSNGTEI